MQRNECPDHITQDACTYTVLMLSSVQHVLPAMEDLWGLCLEQSICTVHASVRNIHNVHRREKINLLS